MNKPGLLLVDPRPEAAEEINSLLRNSGIIIHITSAQSLANIETALSNGSCLLLIYNATSDQQVPVKDALQLAEQSGVTLAIRLRKDEMGVLADAVDTHACLVINMDDDQQLVRLVGQLLDSGRQSGKQELIEEKMAELQARYQLLLNSSKEPVAYIHEGLHIYANGAYLELLQVSDFEEISTLSVLEFMRGSEQDLKQLLREINTGIFPTGPVKVLIGQDRETGIHAELALSAARYEGEECIQMMVQELDVNAALKDELNRLKRMDDVTRLANRRSFVEFIDQFLANEPGSASSHAIMYLEADRTRELQENLSVKDWDRFMSEFATVLSARLENEDLAARLSDSGIAIQVSRKSQNIIQQLADEILEQVRAHEFDMIKSDFSVTCSIGIATIGPLTSDSDEAIGHARSAFLTATGTGDSALRFKPQSAAVSGDDEPWVQRIRHGLDNQDFYSIQLSVANLEGESEGIFENRNFLRSDDGDICTEELMPAAERNDLGAMIDRHLISGLMPLISGTGDQHIINLSENSLLDFSFPSWLLHQLEENGVQGSQLILQFPATAAHTHIKPVKRMMEELKPAGCGFSLSAFDDQRRSSALLAELDIDFVKLRPGLADGLTQNSTHQEIVRNVVHVAGQERVSVMAEDVRDAADLAILWQCGVKLVSGDFLKNSPQVAGQ